MADVTDDLLPVFPFRINWKQGVSERLEWKTDTLGDFLGNEQRRGLRLTPRREFEVTLSLWDQDRAFWDLWLHRMGGTEMLLPIWHDSVRATQAAVQGQKTIWVDTRGLEFKIGSYGLLRGNTAMSYERVLIAEVYADRIVTAQPLGRTWPLGTRVEPLIRGRMTDQTSVKAINSRVSESQAVFEATRAQPYDLGVDTWDQYLGYPVLATQPNRSEDISSAFQWAFSESDSLTGRRYRKSDTGRAMVQQKHAWMLRGRTAKAAFRSLLYRLNGALGTLWLPTFSDDLVMSRNIAANGTSIYVKAVGFALTGGPTSGRQYIVIQKRDGTRLYRKITGTAASGNAAEERLVLDAGIAAGLAMADVTRVSWMDTARFQNDKIEFNHVNAADGVTTVAGLFQTFRNERVSPAVIQYPIPKANMIFSPCGPDAPEGPDPCAPVFQGVYLTVAFSAPDPCNPQWSGNRDITIQRIQPNGPGGRTIDTIVLPFQPTPGVSEIKESYVANNPALQGQTLIRITQTDWNTVVAEYFFPCVFVYAHQFPSARYCGSVGKDGGTAMVTVAYAGEAGTSYTQYTGGNTDSYFPPR